MIELSVTRYSYRFRVSGFSGAPVVEANAGLSDHRVAVEWVRENIVASGGDPSRIVNFGQSAGGASVDYWSFAWKTDPIVSGLVPMSGHRRVFYPTRQNMREHHDTMFLRQSVAEP
jgi:carboxylesterase type B